MNTRHTVARPVQRQVRGREERSRPGKHQRGDGAEQRRKRICRQASPARARDRPERHGAAAPGRRAAARSRPGVPPPPASRRCQAAGPWRAPAGAAPRALRRRRAARRRGEEAAGLMTLRFEGYRDSVRSDAAACVRRRPAAVQERERRRRTARHCDIHGDDSLHAGAGTRKLGPNTPPEARTHRPRGRASARAWRRRPCAGRSACAR